MNIIQEALDLGATKAEIKGEKHPVLLGKFSKSIDASAFASLCLGEGFKQARARGDGSIIIPLRRSRKLILRR